MISLKSVKLRLDVFAKPKNAAFIGTSLEQESVLINVLIKRIVHGKKKNAVITSLILSLCDLSKRIF